jgi:hypothetical protein
MLISVFFTGEISPKGDFFLPLAYLWRNLNPKKTFLLPKIHPFWPFVIHLNPFSSAFRAFIQHPDELASGYVLVVPPKRKTKNHRKNTARNISTVDATLEDRILALQVCFWKRLQVYYSTHSVTILAASIHFCSIHVLVNDEEENNILCELFVPKHLEAYFTPVKPTILWHSQSWESHLSNCYSN